jgi:hypothetical protein
MNIPIPRKTFARLAIMTVGGLLFAFLVPLQGDSVSDSGRAAAAFFMVGLGLLLVMQAVARRNKLHTDVAFELNKLRRIYHICRNMSAVDDRFRPWFTEIHGHLLAYLSSFGGKTFNQYEQSNALYRKLSYHVYTVPELTSPKDQVLFADLLATTGAIAEARQRIVETRDNRLSAYGWTVFLLAVMGHIIVTLQSTHDVLAERVIAGVAIVLGLLLVDLLWEVDSLEAEQTVFPKRYADNIARLELTRHD